VIAWADGEAAPKGSRRGQPRSGGWTPEQYERCKKEADSDRAVRPVAQANMPPALDWIDAMRRDARIQTCLVRQHLVVHSWSKRRFDDRLNHAEQFLTETKNARKRGQSKWLAIGRRDARVGLSRRRSRVRVPSLPSLEVPANKRVLLSGLETIRRPTAQSWPTTTTQNPWKSRFPICVCVRSHEQNRSGAVASLNSAR
jgi:hypothetical protein